MPDHYETLQLSPSADPDTVERVYRLLAKRYHPDNPVSGDPQRFTDLRRAYEVLSDPDARAAYDARYDDERQAELRLYRPPGSPDDPGEDQRVLHSILTVLYLARRRDPGDAGMAPYHLERMLGTPREHLDFPLWYLKQRALVEVQPNGLLAITVDGVDALGRNDFSLPVHRLLRPAPVEEGGGAMEELAGAP